MNGFKKSKLLVYYFYGIFFLFFSCNTNDSNDYSSRDSKEKVLRSKILNEDVNISKNIYDKYFILNRYSGLTTIQITLKLFKDDSLMIYSLSKEEYYKFKNKYSNEDPRYYYPFGIKKYISKTTNLIGCELFSILDTLVIANQAFDHINRAEIIRESKVELFYWDASNQHEITQDYLNYEYFNSFIKSIPRMYNNDSAAIRLMNEPIDEINN